MRGRRVPEVARRRRGRAQPDDANLPNRIDPPSLDKRPEATRFRVEDLLELVPKGRIRVPPFQGPWRWEPKDIEKFFDSLYRGYPVGTLLLWKRKGEKTTLSLGPHAFAVPTRNDALWVVDGQQRITALVGTLMMSSDQKPRTEFDLYFDLATQTWARPVRQKPPGKDWIPMRVVVDAEDLFAWLDEYRKREPPKERVQLAIRLGKLIREYEMPAYVVDTDDERVLRQVFKRVNTAGKPLGETAVFDALHGVPGKSEPGELREVAERLRGTGFGDFEEDVLLKSLRSVLGQDVATDYDMDLPQGVKVGEALARTERALRLVVTFFRDDAKISHLRLLPYHMTIVTLAVFFDQHQEPSTRTRLLLTRWVWRGAITGTHAGDTVTLRSTLKAVREIREAESVSALLAAIPKRPEPPSMLGRFNFRTARSKLEALALLALEPKHFGTGRPVSVADLFAKNRPETLDRSETFPTLINAPAKAASELKQRVSTIANRLVHPPVDISELRALLRSEVPEEIIKSHGISRIALKKLMSDDAAGFLKDRGDTLKAHIERFLEARAAWNQSDRPALARHLVADD